MYLSKSPRSEVLSLAKNGRVVTRCYRIVRGKKRGDDLWFAYRLPHLVVPVQDSCSKEGLAYLASLHCREKGLGCTHSSSFCVSPREKFV